MADNKRPNESEGIEIPDIDDRYQDAENTLINYIRSNDNELSNAIEYVLFNNQRRYEYLEGLLANFCECGCVCNGLWEEEEDSFFYRLSNLPEIQNQWKLNSNNNENEGVNIADKVQRRIINLDGFTEHAIEMNFIEVEGFDDYAKKEDNIEDLRSSAIVVYNRLLWLQDLFHELFEEE
jgi:hypothetical protein